MAGTWNEGSWGSGNFGDQNSITVQVTSVVDNPIAWNNSLFGNGNWGGQFNNIGISLSNEIVISEINIGWGSDGWGIENWGESGSSVVLSGNLLNIGIGGPANGWGQLDWNNSGNQWGGISTVSVGLGQQINVNGIQLNTSINSVSLDISLDVYPTGSQINISEGLADAGPDANITGQQIGIYSPGSVSISTEINSGWGRRNWGTYDWGGDGISITQAITGQQLNISQGEESSSANADVQVASTYQAGWGVVAWGSQKWGQGELDIAMTISEGEVDPSPDATVTGIGITISLAVGTVVIGTGNVTLTGQQLNITQGTAIGVPNTLASVTGIGLNIALGTVFAGATAVIPVTGNGLTITLNSINNQIWTEINTGTDATWTKVDTAA
jgi:hypothetical protein